ncbi:helix-turn-helix domain-containing protein [Sphingomonas sp. NCPPB 2930]|uniref:helix-turn-helix domain-containing protein n=1 Tax=Sphingomonas sp. NCPPB 2930 TaxID=3162788 RepID=UPI0036DB5F62
MNWPFIVKQVRKSKYWTQESLACILGSSQTTISRWENGLQKPEAIYRSWLLAQLIENDPITLDRLILPTLKQSQFAKSLVDKDMKFVEFSQGMRKTLGRKVSLVQDSYITDLMPDCLKQSLQECFVDMTKPSGEIFSVSHFGSGYVLKDKIMHKTFSVMKIDGIRFILCEDSIIEELPHNPWKLTITTFDEIL